MLKIVALRCNYCKSGHFLFFFIQLCGYFFLIYATSAVVKNLNIKISADVEKWSGFVQNDYRDEKLAGKNCNRLWIFVCSRKLYEM